MGRGTELEKIEKLFPEEYKWQCQGAKRGRKNGKAAKWYCGNFWNSYFRFSYMLMCKEFVYFPSLFQERLCLLETRIHSIFCNYEAVITHLIKN
jgi:hypothetical protein